MGTTYTQTVEVKVWKEHTCAGCDSVYRYLLQRTMKGEGGTPEAAEKAAQKLVVKALEREVDLQPCPGCGLYQPDMIAAQRSTRHWWTFWAGTPIYGLLLILVLTDVMTLGTGALLAGLCAIPLAIAHILIDLQDPNKNLDDNRRLAKRKEKDGDLWVPDDSPEPSEEDRPIGNGRNSGHVICYALLGAAVLAFLLPWGLKVAMGMKSNAGWYPDVAGPGDSTYVYFDQKVQNAVKGMWSGQPQVTVLNAGELGGPVAIPATAKSDSWAGSISISSKQSKSSSPALWAKLQLPADPRLAGKTLQLQIDMNVRYPALMGGNSFNDQSMRASHKATLQLSGSGAGGLYKGSFWLGFIGGCGLLFAAGGLLPMFTNRFRDKAQPTRIHVPGKKGRSEDEDVEDAEEVEEAEAVEERPRRIRAGEDRDRERQRVRRRDEEDEDEDERPRRRSRAE